jgi:polyhydroxyalkanoate synthase
METPTWDKAFKLQMDTVDRTSGFFLKMARMNEMLLNPPEVKTGCTPHEIVYRKHKTKLIRYRAAGKAVHRTPILIAFALVNKPYILDLIPGKSVVEILLAGGFDVFMADWGVPSDSDRDRGLDDYVNLYLDRMVDKVREITGSDRVTLMGYCMGGAMSLMYTSLHQEKVQNLVLMATPFDFSGNEGILYQWSKEFPVEELVDIYGNCPGWYLNMSFAAMKPTGILDKASSFFGNVLDDDFVKLFLAMEKWASDAQPVPGRAYREFVEGCFQKNLLMQNRLQVGEKVVNLKNIACPLLNVVAEKDHLVPPSSSLAAGDYTSSTDREVMKCPTGHIGLSVSGKALKNLWPAAVKWLKERSGPLSRKWEA